MNKPRLVIIGGGYLGSDLAKSLDAEMDVTLIGLDVEFTTVWLRALLASLPVAAVMSVLGALVIKPRMQAFMAA